MLTAKTKQKVLTFLEQNPGTTKAAVGKATKVTGLPLTNFIKSLRKDGVLTEEVEGEDVKLFFKSPEPDKGTVREGEESVPGSEVTKPEQEHTIKGKGRDNSVYLYNNVEYKKGRLIHRILADHISKAKGKMTLEKLRADIPENLQKRFHVFETEDKARELGSSGRDRYLLKEEELLVVKKGAKNVNIAVTNQWTAASIAPVLKHLASLGYKVKVKD